MNAIAISGLAVGITILVVLVRLSVMVGRVLERIDFFPTKEDLMKTTSDLKEWCELRFVRRT